MDMHTGDYQRVETMKQVTKYDYCWDLDDQA